MSLENMNFDQVARQPDGVAGPQDVEINALLSHMQRPIEDTTQLSMKQLAPNAPRAAKDVPPQSIKELHATLDQMNVSFGQAVLAFIFGAGPIGLGILYLVKSQKKDEIIEEFARANLGQELHGDLSAVRNNVAEIRAGLERLDNFEQLKGEAEDLFGQVQEFQKGPLAAIQQAMRSVDNERIATAGFSQLRSTSSPLLESFGDEHSQMLLKSTISKLTPDQRAEYEAQIQDFQDKEQALHAFIDHHKQSSHMADTQQMHHLLSSFDESSLALTNMMAEIMGGGPPGAGTIALQALFLS